MPVLMGLLATLLSACREYPARYHQAAADDGGPASDAGAGRGDGGLPDAGQTRDGGVAPDAGVNLDIRPSAAPASGACLADGWCWVNPIPSGEDMYDIFGFTDDDVWAVGHEGLVLHWDGTSWKSIPSGTFADLTHIWGSTPDDIWIGGWERGPAANDPGAAVLFRWDGRTLSRVTAPAPNGRIAQISGTGAADVWLIQSGILWRWNGSAWLKTAATESVSALDVHGADDVWAASPRDGISHWDGRQWAPTFTWPPTRSLEMIGLVVEDEASIWALTSEEQWEQRALFHWDGTRWNELSRYYTYFSRRILRDDSAGILVLRNGNLEHWMAPGVIAESRPAPYFDFMWRSASGTVWADGRLGVLFRGRAGTWEDFRHLPFSGMSAVHGRGADNVWMVGPAGHVLHWDGHALLPVDAGTNQSLSAVWVGGSDEVWIGGRETLRSFDGNVWYEYPLSGMWAERISGRRGEDIHVVSDSIRYYGTPGETRNIPQRVDTIRGGRRVASRTPSHGLPDSYAGCCNVVRDVLALPAGEMFLLGAYGYWHSGTRLDRLRDGTWEQILDHSQIEAWRMHATTDASMWLFGHYAAIHGDGMVFRGGAWAEAIWMWSEVDRDVWLLTPDGLIRCVGDSCTQSLDGPLVGTPPLSQFWGSGEDLWGIGDGAEIMRHPPPERN